MKRAIVRCAVLALFAAFPLAAQSGAWTAAGSTGAIDEASLGLYSVSGTTLLNLTGTTGTVVSRFNVTNTFGGGITDTPPWTTLEMTYFDIDPAGTVSAVLFKVNRCTNVVTVVCGVVSVDATAPTCLSCTFPAPLNFAANHYYVEAKVSRTAANVAPQLFGLRIF